MDVDQELGALLLLAKDPVHYITVVEMEVLDSLVLVLENSEADSVIKVLQILEEVSANEDAKAKVAQFPDICKPIQKLSQKENGSERQNLASKLYNTFWPARQTLESIKMLASNPDLCTSFVVDDSMLGSLVTMLANNDPNIVQLTLETLYQMAEWTKHRPKMKYFKGLLEQIESLQSRNSSETVSKLVNKVHERLWGGEEKEHTVDCPNTPTKQDNCDKCKEDTLKDTSNVFRETKQTQKPAKQKGKIRGKTIVLQIKGLDHKDDVELCRNRILSVKGLISITFDLKKKRSIIRARSELKPEMLAEAIALTKTMSCEQVIKDDAGNETFVAFGLNLDGVNKENEDMPDYPEEDSPVIKGAKNMASMGSSTPGSGSWGFVKTVGDFISSSFYW